MAKREKRTPVLSWCFVDLEKDFDSVKREALWYNMRKRG
jgi:hypothetical protein